MKTKSLLIILSFFSIISLIFLSCGNRDKRIERVAQNQPIDTAGTGIKEPNSKLISEVTFLIENSGSMLGYVNKANNFKDAIITLSLFPELDHSKKEFYFINGKKISLNLIGTDPEFLKNNLNQISFTKYGDTRYSNLTRMFEEALSFAKDNEISILISDCIYDVGEEQDPLTALKIETEKTKKVFRDRLTNENIQTVIIKAESQFEGKYFFASQKGYQKINQIRPYYIMIFGNSELLNKNFTEENISKKIAGYVSSARFMKINNVRIPYQATNEKSKGTFKFDPVDKNKLINVKKDRNSNEFQFSIAVDYSSLPFSDTYYKTIKNYELKNTYKIIDIYTPNKLIYGVPFHISHLITLNTTSSPYGIIELTLKYIIPTWITETNSNNELKIIGDSTHTFGFKNLTDAITEAYQYKNQQQNIATFKLEILK